MLSHRLEILEIMTIHSGCVYSALFLRPGFAFLFAFVLRPGVALVCILRLSLFLEQAHDLRSSVHRRKERATGAKKTQRKCKKKTGDSSLVREQLNQLFTHNTAVATMFCVASCDHPRPIGQDLYRGLDLLRVLRTQLVLHTTAVATTVCNAPCDDRPVA